MKIVHKHYRCTSGFTLIEMVIAMAIATVIGFSMANLNSTLIEQQQSQKTKTYMQSILSQFLMQLRSEILRSTSFDVSPTGNVLTLNLGALNNSSAVTVVYTYDSTNHTMMRTEGLSSVSMTDSLPLNLKPLVGFQCTKTVGNGCFAKITEANRSEGLKIEKLSVQTFTPVSKQTRITQAFGELGTTVTDFTLFKPIGMLIP